MIVVARNFVRTPPPKRLAVSGETLVCDQNTAMRHTHGVFSRRDRNFRETRTVI